MDDYFPFLSLLYMYDENELEDSMSENSVEDSSDIDLVCYEDLLNKYKLNVKLLQKQNTHNSDNCVINSCIHGKNKCKIYCTICKDTFSCWQCHNDSSEHIISPYRMFDDNTVKIQCVKCNNIQKWNNNCYKCNCEFGNYHCKECKLIEICNEENNIFHCKKCKLCYYGDKTQFIHCNKCNCCLLENIYDEHICIIDKRHNKCSICLDEINNGAQIKALKCGHILHHLCCEILLNSDNKNCPLCKSII